MKMKITEKSYDAQKESAAQRRIRNIYLAYRYFPCLPAFDAMFASFRSERDMLFRNTASPPYPRLLGLSLLNLCAKHWLSLVTDPQSCEHYQCLLEASADPDGFELLFGYPNYLLRAEFTEGLEPQFRLRLRYWSQRASQNAGQAGRTWPSTLARNLDRLRGETGLSYDDLATKTGLDKTLIMGHIVHGNKPYPKTLVVYADTFTALLQRQVSVSDLLATGGQFVGPPDFHGDSTPSCQPTGAT